MKKTLLLAFLFQAFVSYSQTVNLTVDALQIHGKISPWLYGRNNNLSGNSGSPVSAANWTRYRDAGLRMYRENGGNNSTKYNWRRKLTSHPDWYNNVYSINWDYAASSLLNNTSNTQGLFAFQLLGKAAKSSSFNFNDWCYNNSAWWSGTTNDWAGGGGPSCGAYAGNGGSGDINTYLEDWTADSTVGILDYWFDQLELDSTRLVYWNMDNEPEVWNGTHSDVVTSNITAEQYMQKYFAVAKAARKKYKNIKLVGPAFTNEWQWYTWNNQKVQDLNNPSVSYTWAEYFIKRVAEEQQASGLRLLDVLDFHFYPGTEDDIPATLQLHRVWYDTHYDFPKANGVKVSGPGGWDNNLSKEYIFHRCNQWLAQYMGANHNVRMGISECGAIDHSDPNVVAAWYASHLGVFAENNVELFTPWDWYIGQWEVLHLFSNYFGTHSIQTTSSLNETVSGYSSLSSDGDSLMIAVVNRDRTASRNVNIALQNYIPSASQVNGFQLAGLPAAETFVSKTTNALQEKIYSVTGNNLSITVPALSVTLIQIPTSDPVVTTNRQAVSAMDISLYPNPAKNTLSIETNSYTPSRILITDMLGRVYQTKTISGKADMDISALEQGQYIVQLIKDDKVLVKKFVKE